MPFLIASQNRQTLRILFSLFAVIALSTFSPFFALAAQDAEPPAVQEEGKKVTIHTAAPLREVLENLLRSQAASCVIGPGVEGIVTVHLTDVNFEEALNYLLTSTTPELTYTRDKNNVYVIKVKPKTVEPPVINVNNTMPQTTPESSNELQPSIILSGTDPILQALQLQLIHLQTRRATMIGYGDAFPAVALLKQQIAFTQQAIQDHLHPKLVKALAAKPIFPVKPATTKSKTAPVATPVKATTGTKL